MGKANGIPGTYLATFGAAGALEMHVLDTTDLRTGRAVLTFRLEERDRLVGRLRSQDGRPFRYVILDDEALMPFERDEDVLFEDGSEEALAVHEVDWRAPAAGNWYFVLEAKDLPGPAVEVALRREGSHPLLRP